MSATPITTSVVTRRAALAVLAGGASACATAGGVSGTRTYTAGEQGMAVNSHLVVADNEALLIDAQFLTADARAVAGMVRRSGARLSRVFITHAHPDHLFGAAVIRDQFPQATFLAHPEVAAACRAMAPVGMRFMRPEFGDALPADVVLPEPWGEPELPVGRRRLSIRTIPRAEAGLQTVVLDGERSELFSGDLLYSGTHLYLGERAYAGWREALDTLAALNLSTARPGHGPVGPTLQLIDETRRYIADFERVVSRRPDRVTAERELRALHPSRRGARLLRLSLAEVLPSA